MVVINIYHIVSLCISSLQHTLRITLLFPILQVLSTNAIAVRVPQSPRPGEVDITLVFKGSQYCITNPGKFLYIGK